MDIKEAAREIPIAFSADVIVAGGKWGRYQRLRPLRGAEQIPS
jgi:hypothetical protein